jgi:sensor histidine kinase YesM
VNQTHGLWEHLRFLNLLVVLDEWVLDWTAFGIIDLHESAAGGVFVHGIHNSVGTMVLLLHEIIVLGTCSSLLLVFTVCKSYLTSFKCGQLLFRLRVTLYHFKVLAVF